MFLTGLYVLPSVLLSSLCCRLDGALIFCRISFNLDEGLLLLKAWMGWIFIEICNGGPLFWEGDLELCLSLGWRSHFLLDFFFQI